MNEHLDEIGCNETRSRNNIHLRKVCSSSLGQSITFGPQEGEADVLLLLLLLGVAAGGLGLGGG